MAIIAQHTPEPWEAKVIDGFTEQKPYILGPHREEIAVMLDWATRPIFPLEQQANADRIVACVNGCEGINPEAVPELVAACMSFVRGLDAAVERRDPAAERLSYHHGRIGAAIAKARGTQ